MYWDAMPDYKPTRREVIASTVGLATAGSAAILTSSESSSAASLSGEFSIPDVTKQVTNPVSGLRLSVNGTAAWQADNTPTKAILRLKVARSGAFQQLDAMTLPDLKRDYSHDFAFENINLLDHERLQVSAVNPTEIGETETVNLQARLALSVKKDGHTLAEDKLTEQLSIEVTRSMGSVRVELGASGSVSVATSD